MTMARSQPGQNNVCVQLGVRRLRIVQNEHTERELVRLVQKY